MRHRTVLPPSNPLPCLQCPCNSNNISTSTSNITRNITNSSNSSIMPPTRHLRLSPPHRAHRRIPLLPSSCNSSSNTRLPPNCSTPLPSSRPRSSSTACARTSRSSATSATGSSTRCSSTTCACSRRSSARPRRLSGLCRRVCGGRGAGCSVVWCSVVGGERLWYI
ncbi:hypothetical protein DFH08DRAFT_858399 [Mycena albidolilacea]|uniref:Uncharacterized protein n=1 Tax=Mycena albidolilacea TaxID=1033008 RepID=A0AAD7A9Q9_9AGAR|nr:hypothetical protein DFH08DRAFT_858399 [Mycena albidolilacea]